MSITTAILGATTLLGAGTSVVLAIRMAGLRRDLESASRDAETYRQGLVEANRQTRAANVAREETERRLQQELEDLHVAIDHSGDPAARAAVAVSGLRRMFSQIKAGHH